MRPPPLIPKSRLNHNRKHHLTTTKPRPHYDRNTTESQLTTDRTAPLSERSNDRMAKMPITRERNPDMLDAESQHRRKLTMC